MAEEFDQVNTSLTKDDIRMLEAMMAEDAYVNRSAFVRRIIRQEWSRRHPKPVDAPAEQAK